jgi:BolA protein
MTSLSRFFAAAVRDCSPLTNLFELYLSSCPRFNGVPCLCFFFSPQLNCVEWSLRRLPSNKVHKPRHMAYNEGPVRQEVIRLIQASVLNEWQRLHPSGTAPQSSPPSGAVTSDQQGTLDPDQMLQEALPILLVNNESHEHNVPPKSELHFKVVVVSDIFAGKPLLARHRFINAALSSLLEKKDDSNHGQRSTGQNGFHVHALALTTKTLEEWRECGGSTEASPKCLGGMAHFRK